MIKQSGWTVFRNSTPKVAEIEGHLEMWRGSDPKMASLDSLGMMPHWCWRATHWGLGIIPNLVEYRISIENSIDMFEKKMKTPDRDSYDSWTLEDQDLMRKISGSIKLLHSDHSGPVLAKLPKPAALKGWAIQQRSGNTLAPPNVAIAHVL